MIIMPKEINKTIKITRENLEELFSAYSIRMYNEKFLLSKKIILDELIKKYAQTT